MAKLPPPPPPVRRNRQKKKKTKKVKKRNGGGEKGGDGGGSFATFAYSVIPELGYHLRPMVRKSKSLLLGHISRIFKKNGGGTASDAENRHLPPNFFLSFLAELDNSESFETNFVFQKKNPSDLLSI